mgnify:CR=1 FL=1
MFSLVIALCFVVIFTAVNFTKNNSKFVATDSMKNAENQVAMSYGVAEETIDASQYVKFSAFFTREVDENAEKLAGTAKNVDETDILFIDLNVLTEGYLESGATITLNGENFNYKVNI